MRLATRPAARRTQAIVTVVLAMTETPTLTDISDGLSDFLNVQSGLVFLAI